MCPNLMETKSLLIQSGKIALVWSLLLVFLAPFLFVSVLGIVNQFQEPQVWGKEGQVKNGHFICGYGGFYSMYHEDYCSFKEFIQDTWDNYQLIYLFTLASASEFIRSAFSPLIIFLLVYTVLFFIIYTVRTMRQKSQ